MNGEEVVSLSIRALALDVDGTIADTDPIHAEAWAAALESVTGHRFDVRAYLKACVKGAMTPKQFLRPLSEPADWESIEAEKRRIYPAMLAQRATLTRGLREMLQDARSAGVGLAIVSSSSRESVEALLLGPWASPFPDVLVTRSDTLGSKPEPSPYQTAVSKLGVAVGTVVAFEDSEAGVLSATAAGLICVQVGLRYATAAQLRIRDFRDCSITSDSDGPHISVRRW